ncbi:MAG: FAD-dependent oxidoreductase [Clostridia bacterium]|nr:FAD-dependent oxidoreductase [Clostridia bacterium]
MKTIRHIQEVPVTGSYHVIVAGGGLSGAAAALAAGRRGKKVLLVEKQCWLGGLATSGLVNFWVPLCNGRGKMIIKGMAEEFLRLSVKYGFDTFPESWKEGEPENPTQERCVSHFSSGLFALQLLELLKQSGVTILYDALITGVQMENGHCSGVFIDGKSGRQFYEAGVVVDATGDADVLKMAGVPTVDGENYFTYYGEGISLEGCRRALETGNLWHAYQHPSGGPSNLYGHQHPKDKPTYKGVSLEVVNEYLQENQLLMLEKEKNKPRMERNVHMLPGMPQFRTSRRIDGDETLDGADEYRHFETSIGAICDFERRDILYEVPYGTLVKNGFDNLITCGRSASASGWGWDVLRVIPPAVLTGQAAGIAAAMSLDSGAPLPELPVKPLQDALSETGVIIHFEDAWVPKDKSGENAALSDHI